VVVFKHQKALDKMPLGFAIMIRTQHNIVYLYGATCVYIKRKQGGFQSLIKKLVTLGIAVLILFSVAGLTACGDKEDKTMGTFYSLQEAYDEGLLTEQDLMSIAYYHGSLGGVAGTFAPTPKDPEIIGKELEKAIKQSFLDDFIDEDGWTIDDFSISYYGTYDNAVAIFAIFPGGGIDAPWNEIIAGVTFSYGYPCTGILIFKNTKTEEQKS